jgi:hypothetical protein
MNASPSTAAATASVPLALVQQFAPTIVFHPDEIFLPCTIEYLLENATLKADPALPLPNQFISGGNGSDGAIPSYAAYNNGLYLAYQDLDDNIWLSSSPDGTVTWSQPVQVCVGTNPSLAAHSDGKLWMAYTSGQTIYMTHTTDGLTWQPSWSIQDQATTYPILTSFNNSLWIVYTDSSSSQLWITNSSDGNTWNCWQIPGGTSVPAVTTFNGSLWLVYSDSNSSQLYCASSPDGHTWNTNAIEGQNSSVPALTTFNNALWIVYSDANSSDMYASTSSDGVNWTVKPIPDQFTSVPALAVIGQQLCMVYPDSTPVSTPSGYQRQLWASVSPDGWNWQPNDIANPSQQDMANNFNGQYYLAIDEAAYGGQGLAAPMYYATQVFADYTEITYLLFFGFNGCQTVHIPFAGGNYACVLYDYARHQGDLERVTIRISNDPANPQVQLVVTESHGDASQWTPGQVSFAAGTSSAIVHSSLNAHGTFIAGQQGPWISKKDVEVADFGDAIGDGGTWTPSEYRLVGLDGQGNPVNEQVWAKFCGRIGAHQDNHLTAGTDYQRNDLSGALWAYIRTCAGLADAFNLLPADATSGDGPHGLGTRAYIRPASQSPDAAAVPSLKADRAAAPRAAQRDLVGA